MASYLNLALLAATVCSAASIHGEHSWIVPDKSHKTPRSSSPGYIAAPLVATNGTDARLAKRQLPTAVYNTDIGTTYLVHMSIGTPPQTVYLALDTGSSETWVNPTCSTASTPEQVAECKSYPRYNPDKSSTYDYGYLDFYLTYGKGEAEGIYGLDAIQIGGATIEYNMFGVADSSTDLTTGLLAVGFGMEILGHNGVIDEMAYEMLIASRAFSLDLGGIDSASGALIFGGVDTKKYTGPLEKLPILDPNGSPDGNLRYWVNMNSVGITKPGSTTSKKYTSSSYQQAVVLDSGSTLSYLPTDLVKVMLADFTGVKDAGNGFHSINCSQYNLPGTVDFGFGKTTIKVPYHQFIWNPAPNECYFGAIAEDPASFDTWILGDTVMRSMYVVFDQDNFNIHVANYVDCGTNIIPINAGSDAVPSVTGACKAPVVTGTPSSTSSTKTTTSSTKTAATPTTMKTSSTTSTTTTKKSTSTSSSSTKRTNSSTKTSSSKTTSSTKTSTTMSTARTTSTAKTSSTAKTTSQTTSKVKRAMVTEAARL